MGCPFFFLPTWPKSSSFPYPSQWCQRPRWQERKGERSPRLPAWASSAFFPHSLQTFYGNLVFPREPPVGFTQPRAEESGVSRAACRMRRNRRPSVPTGRARRGKSSHPHPYHTAGSVLFSFSGRFTNLLQKARQDLAPNQRPHGCVIGVSMSVCPCSGRVKC